jgi:ABC-type glutathione transport system ATPase component
MTAPSTHEPPATSGGVLLELRDVSKTFRAGGWSQARRHPVRAVSGVSLTVHAGEAVGLIGESGSGKTTVARMTLGLVRPDRGEVIFNGRDLARATERDLRVARRDMHLVFQDPYESLSPRLQVSDLVA